MEFTQDLGNSSYNIEAKVRITLGVPVYGIGIDPDIYENHILLTASSGGFIRNLAMPKNLLVHYARNKIVDDVLEDEFTNPDEDYILWLDQDVIVGPGTLNKLIADNKDIVSGLYFQKAPPFYPLILNQQEHQKGGVHSNIIDYPEGIHQVDAVGFGCVLTKVSVFKTIPKPWFDWTPESGEDIDFCIKCKKYGVGIWYDSSILCGHQGERKVFTFDDFKPYKGMKAKLKGE